MIQNNELYQLLGKCGWRGRLKPEAYAQYNFVMAIRALSIEGKLKATWSSISNEYGGHYQQVYGAFKKAMGQIKGAPDMQFAWKSGSGYIEFKSEKGRQTPEQKLFQKWCESIGVHYRIARTPEEALSILREWNILED